MRDFGPIRRGVMLAPGTDPDAAAPYIPMARVMLGILKNRMAQGGLAQLSRTYHLPDGTVVTVASRHGQDSVWITPPPGVAPSYPAQPVPQFEPPSVRVPRPLTPPQTLILPGGLTIVGECDDQANGWLIGGSNGAVDFIGHAVRWNASGQVEDLGYPPGMLLSGATGCSADGSAIVGSANDNNNFANYIGWRWTKAHGFQDLGGLGTDIFGNINTHATGISADGSIVCGWSYNGSQTLPFVWKASTGMVALPVPGLNSCVAWGISGDGQYVCGSVSLNDGRTQAAIWHKGQLKVLGNPASGGSWGFTNDARAVSNTGVAVGSTTRDGSTLAACYWDKNGNQIMLSGYGAQTASAQAITPDGSVIVGWMDGGITDQTYCRWAGDAVGGGKTGFYWTAKTGVVVSPDCPGSLVSPDGVFIVGAAQATKDAAGNYVNPGIVVMNRITGARRLFPGLTGEFSSRPIGLGFPAPQTVTVPGSD
jgi:uncharacterized membrane protein